MITGLLLKGDSAKVVTFTVHEPPFPPADRVDRADEVVFVKDGFNWGAFLLPPFWLAANRMWLALIGYLVLVMVMTGVMAALEVSPDWALIVFLALNLIVGFEAETLRRLALEGKGWATLGTVSGRNLAECERRFFDGWLPGQPMIAFDRAPRTAPPAAPTATAGVSAPAAAPATFVTKPGKLAAWRSRLPRPFRS